MNLIKFAKVLAGTAMIGVLASCTNESLEPADIDVKNDFTTAWLKRFGLIDSAQTWNTAENIMVSVDQTVLGADGTLYLYEKDPATGARSIACISTPGDYVIDIYRGTEMLYGRVYDKAGNYQELTYSVSDTSRADAPAASRASVSDTVDKYGRWLLAAEDLGEADDFDFNDIVIAIYNQAGSNEVEVTAMAAGGVYESKVYYKDVFLFEIHQALGSPVKKTGSYSMINTYSFGKTGQTVKITVDDDFDITRNMGDFRIEVTKANGKLNIDTYSVNAPETGSTPQMLLMPYSWSWPAEKVRIDEAYPNFKNWNKDVDHFGFWTEKVKASSTISHP